MRIRYKIKITGKVQGVFYRATAKEAADKLNINGWVKNDSDGSVIIDVSGEEENMNEFIEWCRQGPPNAIVSEVLIKRAEFEEMNGFEIRK